MPPEEYFWQGTMLSGWKCRNLLQCLCFVFVLLLLSFLLYFFCYAHLMFLPYSGYYCKVQILRSTPIEISVIAKFARHEQNFAGY